MGAKQGEQSGLMHLVLRNNGVPQGGVDKFIKDNELVDEEQGDSPNLYSSQVPKGQYKQSTQRHIDADADEDDSQNDGDPLLSRMLATNADQLEAKRKWLTDPCQTAASWQSVTTLQDVILSIRPHLFETVVRMRSKVDLVFVLAKLTEQGVFAVMRNNEAKERRFQQCMFDDDFIVVPVRVASKGTTENTVAVIQCDLPDQKTFKCPPHQKNNGYVCSLDKIWGSA